LNDFFYIYDVNIATVDEDEDGGEECSLKIHEEDSDDEVDELELQPTRLKRSTNQTLFTTKHINDDNDAPAKDIVSRL